MKRNKIASTVALTLVVAVVGGVVNTPLVHADSFNTYKITTELDSAISKQSDDEFMKYIDSIDKALVFDNGQYTLNNDILINAGISSEQQNLLNNTVGYMNQSIQSGELKVNEKGEIDLDTNKTQSTATFTTATLPTATLIKSVKLSANTCGKISMVLAGGAGIATIIAGVLSLPALAAVVAAAAAYGIPLSTIAGGILTIGASVFGYASYGNGLTFKLYNNGKIRVS
jgi:hypothetical protein